VQLLAEFRGSLHATEGALPGVLRWNDCWGADLPLCRSVIVAHQIFKFDPRQASFDGTCTAPLIDHSAIVLYQAPQLHGTRVDLQPSSAYHGGGRVIKRIMHSKPLDRRAFRHAISQLKLKIDMRRGRSVPTIDWVLCCGGY
jgi:hypothetical protein